MKLDFTKFRGGLDALPALYWVAELRSFTAAATQLGVSPSAISQTVKGLEQRLGVALLHRTTRSVGLTEAGERLLAHARPALQGLQDAFDAANALGATPSGLLRINASRGVIASVISRVLPSFLRDHPHVEVEIFADDGLTDIVSGGFDAGFRLGESLEADMVAVRVSPRFRFVVAGSPGYFARFGRPETPQGLADHRCIRFRQTSSRSIYRWEFWEGNRTLEVPVHGPLIVNDTGANIAAARDGIGLAYVAEPLIADEIADGRLETVLTDYLPMTPGLYIYFPSRAQALPKLRAFVDHMRASLVDFEREETARRLR